METKRARAGLLSRDIPVIFYHSRVAGCAATLQSAPVKLRNPGLDKTVPDLLSDVFPASGLQVEYMDQDLGAWCSLTAETEHADLLGGQPLFCVVLPAPQVPQAPQPNQTPQAIKTTVGIFGRSGTLALLQCLVGVEISDKPGQDIGCQVVCAHAPTMQVGSVKCSTRARLVGAVDDLVTRCGAPVMVWSPRFPRGLCFIACPPGATEKVDISVLVLQDHEIFGRDLSETIQKYSGAGTRFYIYVQGAQGDACVELNRRAALGILAPGCPLVFFDDHLLRAVVLGDGEE